MSDKMFESLFNMIVSAVVTHPPGTVVDENNRPVLDAEGNPIVIPPGEDIQRYGWRRV